MTLKQNIPNTIAIASGKGGVGKSTTTLQLARAMTNLGYRIGIFDADIYGPSLPSMCGFPQPVESQGDELLSLKVDGISLMSCGFFTAENEAKILRGPMAANLIKQILTQTVWGKLDYLLIDYPPGTGDIPLTLGQQINLTAAVLVCSPQKAALSDLKKATDMFLTLKTPIAGFIETMSFFKCGGCELKHHPFGQDTIETFAKDLKLPFLGETPFRKELVEQQNLGQGLKTEDGSNSFYQKIANQLVCEIETIRQRNSNDLKRFQMNWS